MINTYVKKTHAKYESPMSYGKKLHAELIQFFFFGFRSRRTLFCQGTLRFEIKYTEDDIINMLEFLVDNIFVVFRGKVSQ